MKYYHDAQGMTAINTDLSVLYPVLYSGAEAKQGAVEVNKAVDSALVYLDSVGYHYKYVSIG